MDKGLGDPNYSLAVYIGNKPPLGCYQTLDVIRPMESGEIACIVDHCGNHWRKIFNIYAKLVFLLNSQEKRGCKTWQDYRDNALLQTGSGEALLFNEDLNFDLLAHDLSINAANTVRLVAGKTHAENLLCDYSIKWLDNQFGVVEEIGLIVTPYFDYRQLSNATLGKLVDLIRATK